MIGSAASMFSIVRGIGFLYNNLIKACCINANLISFLIVFNIDNRATRDAGDI